jgi:hypothetical protein
VERVKQAIERLGNKERYLLDDHRRVFAGLSAITHKAVMQSSKSEAARAMERQPPENPSLKRKREDDLSQEPAATRRASGGTPPESPFPSSQESVPPVPPVVSARKAPTLSETVASETITLSAQIATHDTHVGNRDPQNYFRMTHTGAAFDGVDANSESGARLKAGSFRTEHRGVPQGAEVLTYQANLAAQEASGSVPDQTVLTYEYKTKNAGGSDSDISQDDKSQARAMKNDPPALPWRTVKEPLAPANKSIGALRSTAEKKPTEAALPKRYRTLRRDLRSVAGANLHKVRQNALIRAQRRVGLNPFRDILQPSRQAVAISPAGVRQAFALGMERGDLLRLQQANAGQARPAITLGREPNANLGR